MVCHRIESQNTMFEISFSLTVIARAARIHLAAVQARLLGTLARAVGQLLPAHQALLPQAHPETGLGLNVSFARRDDAFRQLAALLGRTRHPS